MGVDDLNHELYDEEARLKLEIENYLTKVAQLEILVTGSKERNDALEAQISNVID